MISSLSIRVDGRPRVLKYVVLGVCVCLADIFLQPVVEPKNSHITVKESNVVGQPRHLGIDHSQSRGLSGTVGIKYRVSITPISSQNHCKLRHPKCVLVDTAFVVCYLFRNRKTIM